MPRQRLLQRNTATTAAETDFIHIAGPGYSYKISKSNFQKSLTSGFMGALAIADTPTADGVYIATETGTYVNAGSLVVDLDNTLTYIVVGDTQTTFAKVEIPISTLGYAVVSTLTQFDALIAAATESNWIIIDDFTLDANKTIPTGVTIKFNGGVITGAGFTVTGTNTIIEGAPKQLFDNTEFAGTWNNENGYTEWFGAVGDGVTDDSAAFNDAFTVLNKVVGISGKTYAVNEILIDADFDFSESWLLYNGANNGKCINVTGNDNKGSVKIDCDNANCSGLWIDGDKNFILTATIKNQDSDDTSGTSNYGVAIIGNDNLIDNIFCYDFANTGNTNASFPRAASFAGTANGNIIVSIKTKDVDGSTLGVGSSTIMNTANNIEAIDCGDNGVYGLGGDVNIGNIFYSGTDEPVVCAGGTMIIDEVVVKGETSVMLNAQNCEMLSVNSLKTVKDTTQTYGVPQAILRTRSSNTLSNRIVVRNIDVETVDLGANLFAFNNGTAETVVIENARINVTYPATGPGVGSLGDFININEIHLKNFYITYQDNTDALGVSDFIYLEVGAVTRNSYLSNIHFKAYQSDGVTESLAGYRGKGFAQALIQADGFYWKSTLGPYTNQSNLLPHCTASAAPTVGTWNTGKRIYDNDPANGGPVGWVCVSSGEFGTGTEPVFMTFGEVNFA